MGSLFKEVSLRPSCNQCINIGNGRTLSFAEYGQPTGEPVFAFHGAPGNRFQLLGTHFAAEELGIRLIVADRPGYGSSDYYPNRELCDWPVDVAAIADFLGIQRFGVWGISAGGPHALVTAALLPDRVTRVALAASVAPRMHMETTASAQELRAIENVSERKIKWTANSWIVLRQLASIVPWPIARLFINTANRQLMDDKEFRATRSIERNEFGKQSAEALAQDFAILMAPWGFELSEVRQEVTIWHGTADTLVKPEHGELLSTLLSNSNYHKVEGVGHLVAGSLYKDMLMAAANLSNSLRT